jgi:hypothetical protein
VGGARAGWLTRRGGLVVDTLAFLSTVINVD